MYLDSSAMIAIIANENERERMLLRLAQSGSRVTSVVTMLETIMALASKTGDRENAPRQVGQFLHGAGVEIVPVDESCLAPLMEAFAKYHRGSGHAAKLNLGDCISYAVAKSQGVDLLYIGNDFSHTDLA
ncbi:type II toxin-antitoxin system VapC family toxin [Mesorhizobium sp. CAU 1732]|uniref:type II toxin-antitoxin system VapC family toxin n=1 Tax=Mesorhizobium sp. CAU 1732 TaxID=3140358 RepID=UPI00326175BB